MKPESHGQARLAEVVDPPAPQPAPPPERLPVATELVDRLNDARIRYGVYKNRHALQSGLAGANDIDLLVATADVARFEAVLGQLHAIRGRPHPLHDNAVEGRSQWFVPDFATGDYLHLDVVAGLRIGHRFSRHHLAFDFDDVRDWRTALAPLPPIPIVSPHEEARIALLKAMNDLLSWRRGAWLPVGDVLTQTMRDAMADRDDAVFAYRVGTQDVRCKLRTRAGRVEVERSAARQLVELLRSRDGRSRRSEWAELALHHARRLGYLLARSLAATAPLASIRTVALPSGVMVALVGPDGVGKSTQSARLRAIFCKKFRCTTVYLGSGDGGWAVRRAVRRGFEQWRGRAHGGGARRPNELVSALWGMVTALERYLALRRASHAAARGQIVITDRWPQNLGAGLLDGPRHPPAANAGAAHWLSAVEQALYRRMATVRPTDTIHLMSTFEASNARKPGDIDPSSFARRLALMERIRDRDPDIKTVDAGPAADEVTRALFQIAWLALWRAGNEPLRPSAR